MCNLREEGDSSDDACASIFVHKDDDIPNNQRVHVELIEVYDDYFSQEENLHLPSEMQSDAYFMPVNKVVDGNKVAGGGKKHVGMSNKAAGRGKKACWQG